MDRELYLPKPGSTIRTAASAPECPPTTAFATKPALAGG